MNHVIFGVREFEIAFWKSGFWEVRFIECEGNFWSSGWVMECGRA